MSKGTGIKGYTPDRLRRLDDAIKRQEARNARYDADQLVLLESRPGESNRERARLAGL